MENDLIRRKDAIELIRDHATSQGVNWVYAPRVLSLIRTVAPADAQPVRHGRWVSVSLVDHKGRVLMEQYKCSECGRLEDNKQPYCHCGAKMDAKEDGHE